MVEFRRSRRTRTGFVRVCSGKAVVDQSRTCHRMMWECPGLRSVDFGMEGRGIYFMILRAWMWGLRDGRTGILCMCVCGGG